MAEVTPDDWELLTQPDGSGFEELLRRHFRAALAFSRQVVGDEQKAEDITQKAFVNVFVARERFERRAAFRTLLFRVVLNLSINELNRKSGGVSFSEMGDEESRPETFHEDQRSVRPETAAEQRELGEMIRSGLMHLSPKHRAALYLREYQGMAYAEIAEALEATLAEVKIWIHRGRNTMQQLLKPYLDRGERIS